MFSKWTYLDGETHPTLPDLIRRAAQHYGGRDFLVLDDRRITFGDAEKTSREWAKGLLALGVHKASRIGLLMPNDPDWALSFFAIARAGAFTISLSTFYKAAEISWGVDHLDIDTLIISARYLKADYLDLLEQALPGLAGQSSTELHLPDHPYLRRIIVWGECDRPWALRGPAALEDATRAKPQIDDRALRKIEDNVTPSDLLVTICTSGTTQYPKAVVHSHGALLRTTEKFLPYLDVRPDDRVYPAMPFFWIGGLTSTMLPAMFTGSSLCFSPSPRPEDIVAVVKKLGVTLLTGWPTQLQGVIEKDPGLTSLRRGPGMPKDQVGETIMPGSWLGMTESGGMHSLEPVGMPVPSGKGRSFGRQLPGVDRKIVNVETGEEAKPGEVGELYIRGFSMMQGYYKRERDDVFTPDGFFATGDLASIDTDGFLYFHGRNTEMIKTSGVNVSPREVEAALLSCGGIREASVFGWPDEEKGETVTAVLVPSDGADVNPALIQEQLRERISTYKVPSRIVLMDFDAIPRTGSNKVRKKELLDLLMSSE